MHAIRGRLERSFTGRCIGSFLAMQGVDRAMVIASQAFTALVPLLLLVSALAPADRRDLVATAIIDRFALDGGAADAVRQVFANPQDGAVGGLSVVLLVFSGVSLARRMQRMYLQAWQVEPPAGVRGQLSAALGLGALLLEIVLVSAIRTIVGQLPLDWVLGGPLSIAASLVLWTSIPWLLVDRQLSWRRLVPGGAIAAVCVSIYGVATTIYMPRLMTTYSQRYGLFGVTLALVGWLLAIALIVVAATVVAAELDRADDPWARRLRAALHVDVEGHRAPARASKTS